MIVEEIDLSWKLKEKLQAKLHGEKGYYVFPAGARSRFALVYPNSYFVGMSNLGLHIIYEILNKRPDTACERFFLPDKFPYSKGAKTMMHDECCAICVKRDEDTRKRIAALYH